MTSRKATIRNQYGIHCRPSAVIVSEVKQYDGSVQVTNEAGQKADSRNLLALIGLGITCGQTVTIEVDGPDEEEVADRMVELFETDFDFQR